MIGYFNARVNEDLEHSMRKHNVRVMNENGSLFNELCGNHSLKIRRISPGIGSKFPTNNLKCQNRQEF
jgi:hypothetical protein